jgi:predicted AAA+ superfamily ATPase
MTGNFLPAYQKKPKRRLINAPKFYFFDLGVVNYLLKRKQVEFGSETFGKAFEHFIYHELTAYSEYSGLNFEITYWRTASHTEVDFILGDHETAIEVKSSVNVNERHLKGLLKFAEDYSTKNLLVVSNDPYPRLLGKVKVLPWQMFLDMLWNGEIIS